jgi:hypothetical protein
MAKRKKKVAGVDIDWYLISIDRLKQIALVILLILLGLGAWWYFVHEKANPRNAAESAMAEARQALNTLASSKDFSQHRNEFERAQRKLEQAGTLLASAKYVDAESSAVESQTISRAALSGAGGSDNDAQFLTVEGDVQFQKSSTGDWKPAEARTPLYNGDWVKTGDKASAELIFSNGSLYTVGPGALLEIYSQFNPATSKKSNLVQMQIGSIEVATSDDQSTVRTPGSQVTVDSDSTTQVGVDQQKQTAVITEKGSASVAPTEGGAPVKLAIGEKVTATPAGSLSEVKKLLMPPLLREPSDNHPITLGEAQVNFVWDAVPGATAYQFQVSRSRLFTALEINSRRTKTTAAAKVSSEGAFYWRVASVGPDGDIGPYSNPYRFRVTGSGRDSGPGNPDVAPPSLVLKRPYPLGGPFYMIEGNTDAGATVTINDEDVEVESSGHFKKLVSFNKIGRNAVVVKAVNASGKAQVQSVSVVVEE